MASSRAWESVGAREVREIRWATALDQALKALKRTADEARDSRKSAEWKLALAAWMKTHTQASNHWLTANLHLGVPAALSRNLTKYRRHRQSRDPAWKHLKSVSAALGYRG